MSAPDERNPLARALDDVSSGPEARAYTIPVEAVRARALNRRARRVGAVSALVLVLAGGVGVAALASMNRPPAPAIGAPTPGIGTPTQGAGSLEDWPAQFDRCGKPAAGTLPDLGEPMTLTLADASASVPADRAWTASVTADLQGPDEGFVAAVWATELSLVRDGVVVGVQDGPTAPDLSLSLAERLGDNGFATSPFPITTDVTLALASCDPYPTGQGSPDLVPGTYDLVVTQTLSYTGADAAAVGTPTDARVSTRTTLEVTAPAHATTPLGGVPTTATEPARFARCGLQADEVLPDVGGLTVKLDQATPTVPATGSWLGRVTSDVSNIADGLGTTGWSWGTDLTLLRDGIVVGVQDVDGAPADLDAAAAATTMPDELFPLVSYRVGGLSSCDPAGGLLAPGAYDLVVTETVARVDADGARHAARASARTTVTIVDAELATSASATACGASDGDLQRLADPALNAAPIAVSATVPTAMSTADTAGLDVTVRYTGTDGALVSSGSPVVVLTRDGAIVGGFGTGASGTGPGMWVTVGAEGPVGSCATAATGTDVRDLGGEPLPPGSYELWAVTTAHLTTPAAHDVQVAGGPWPVTLHG